MNGLISYNSNSLQTYDKNTQTGIITDDIDLDSIPDRDLSVYPNPTKDIINIKTNKINIEKIFIFDLSGKLLFTSSERRINVSHLPASTYILSVKTPDSVKSFKFIKL